MDARHKKKAFIGLALWLGIIPVAILVCGFYVALFPERRTSHGFADVVVASVFVAQYAAFFWGGGHLAKAKGYSSAILIWGLFCWLAQPILMAVLLFALPDKRANPADRARKKKRHRDTSPIARVVRYRLHALIFNVLGMAGIFVALAFLFLPIGLFESHQSDQVVAIFVYSASYVAILYGCRCWVKAKSWSDAVVFIGLMPFLPLVFPYVRVLVFEIYLRTDAFFLLMLIMPLLLIGVVTTLPDKSGIPKRKRWDRD